MPPSPNDRDPSARTPPGNASDSDRRFGEYVSRLKAHQQLLVEVFARWRQVVPEAPKAGPDDPGLIMSRLWEAARQDGSLDNNPEVGKILQRAWDWTAALLRAGREYRRGIIRFAEWCRNDERLARSPIFQNAHGQNALELVAERLEHGVVGVADAIERRMPPAVRKAQRGECRAYWIHDSDHLDAEVRWSPESEPFRLFREASRAMRRYAEVSEAEGDALGDRLLHALRDGLLDLPDFTTGPVTRDEKGEFTRLVWQRQSIEVEEGLAPPPRPESPGGWTAREPAGDLLWEVFWHRKPELADRLEGWLLFEDSDPAHPSQDPGTVEEFTSRMISALTEVAGCTRDEAGMLLRSLLERRMERQCGPCGDYGKALAFLESQLNLP